MSVAAALPQPGPRRLAEIRQDLSLFDAPPDADGAPRWLIYDPVQHRYFSIGRKAHLLFQLWRSGVSEEDLIESAWVRHATAVTEEDVRDLEAFLQAHSLMVEPRAGGWQALHVMLVRQQRSALKQMVHSYVFFRIPLVNPDRFLTATLGFVRPLGSRAVGLTIILLGLVGVYLASREWDVFLATLIDVFTVPGLVTIGLSLIFVKILHELAHAYVAKSFGCRVPVIGVAFILALPLLFTDVTDAWRLTSRRQRLLVTAAGVLMDLAVSALALFAWAFLPIGLAKSVAFSIATSAWFLSLSVNLNPFMKFDGYHLLTDIVGMDNLHPRANAAARWRLREILFALSAPPPEALSERSLTWLARFGWALWLYRLVLFTAIALVVYHAFFKLAGIVLFVVEIVYFVAAPIGRELKEWLVMRERILSSSRTIWSGLSALLLIGVLAIPWSSTVHIPAVLEAAEVMPVHADLPARIAKIHVAAGTRVVAGQPLLELEAPDVVRQRELTRLKAEVISLRQLRRASDAVDREAALVLDGQWAALEVKQHGLDRQLRELSPRAPFAGRVVEMPASLHAGRWVGIEAPLLVLRSEASGMLRGLIAADDLWRVEVGQTARFVPDDILLPSVETRIESVGMAAVSALDQIELVANFGGRIAAHVGQGQMATPATAQYPVRASPIGALPDGILDKTVTGIIIVTGARESLIARFWRQALRILVRESGF